MMMKNTVTFQDLVIQQIVSFSCIYFFKKTKNVCLYLDTHIVDVNNINRNVDSSNTIDKVAGASVIRISSYMLTLVFIAQVFIRLYIF